MEVISFKQFLTEGTFKQGQFEKEIMISIPRFAQRISGDVTINFISPDKTISIPQYKSISHVGTAAGDETKADVIITGDRKYNISLKDDGFGSYDQSAYSKLIITQYLKKAEANGQLTVENGELNPKRPVFRASAEEIDKCLFGSDIIHGSGFIAVGKTKKINLITIEGNNINVHCKNLIESREDLDDRLYPYFTVRYDSSKMGDSGYNYKGVKCRPVLEPHYNTSKQYSDEESNEEI